MNERYEQELKKMKQLFKDYVFMSEDVDVAVACLRVVDRTRFCLCRGPKTFTISLSPALVSDIPEDIKNLSWFIDLLHKSMETARIECEAVSQHFKNKSADEWRAIELRAEPDENARLAQRHMYR